MMAGRSLRRCRLLENIVVQDTGRATLTQTTNRHGIAYLMSPSEAFSTAPMRCHRRDESIADGRIVQHRFRAGAIYSGRPVPDGCAIHRSERSGIGGWRGKYYGYDGFGRWRRHDWNRASVDSNLHGSVKRPRSDDGGKRRGIAGKLGDVR